MNKKIVVLTGSPRRGGNSSQMADSFIKSAVEKGYEVKRFDTAFMKIRPCVDCKCCFKKGTACVFNNDEYNEIAKAIMESDTIAFVTPCYWFSFSTQLKAVIDRFQSFYIGEKTFPEKNAVLISCGGSSDDDVFDGLKFEFERSMKLLGIKVSGEVLVNNVDKVGDILKTDGLIKSAELVNLI